MRSSNWVPDGVILAFLGPKHRFLQYLNCWKFLNLIFLYENLTNCISFLQDSSEKPFGSPAARAALPKASGLQPSGQLSRTLRVSGREGSSAERFGSPALKEGSSAERFGSPALRAALPNASGLRPRGQLCRTLRVSGPQGSSAEHFGSPATAMKVNPRDQKIQFSVSRDHMVRFFLFFDILSQLCACRTQCPKNVTVRNF